MSAALTTLGFESPNSPSAGGGGAAPGIKIPFSMIATATGAYTAALDLSGAAVVQVSKDGAAYANRVGAAPTSIGGGDYYYVPDVTEVPATPGKIFVKVVLANYAEVHTVEEIDTATADAVISILAALTNTESDVASAIAAAQIAINAETDSQVSAATSTLAADVTSAVTSINNHTDSRVTSAETNIESSVNSNTNSQVSAAVTTIDNHTDAQMAGAVTSIDGHIDGAVATIDGHIDATTATLLDGINRILGLHGDNSLLDGGPGFAAVQYNPRRVLVSARLRTFATSTALAAATAGSADGADNETYRWYLSGADNGAGLDATFERSRSL